MITQKELKEVLHYEPTTGEFTWINSKATWISAGTNAGGLSKRGYVVIGIGSKVYSAHRLAFLYMEGYSPENYVDHKNGIKSDNRWDNLRQVTQLCNMQNQRTYKTSTSGFTGVNYLRSSGKWQAKIGINNSRYFLGYYDTALEAALARYTAEVQCSRWTCNYRSELALAIKDAWPEFKLIE